ncbi:hypothetical protein [Glutamicibacter arilaitensis]
MEAFPTPYPNPDDGPAARHLPSTITAEEHERLGYAVRLDSAA